MMRRLTRYAWFVVPAVGLVELGLHELQIRRVIGDEEWRAAREYLQATVQPEDLVTVAPKWVEPVARHHLGAAILTLPRLGRADATAFRRAFEVSTRGAGDPELASWPVTEQRTLGLVTVRVRENPKPAKVIDTVLNHVGQPEMSVRFVAPPGQERGCSFVHAAARTGTFTGAVVPADRYECSASSVGITILPDLAYDARHCVLVLPPPEGSAVRLHIEGFRWGNELYGYHGLYAVGERPLDGAPTHATYLANGKVVARFAHRDGAGWAHFEQLTGDLAGTTTALDIDIAGGGGALRQYCFVADTR